MSKNYHIGRWNELLKEAQTEKIWSELNRIVSKHRLARVQVKRDSLYDEGKFNYFTDLTQDLFLMLLEKNRFQHYLDTEMSDVEIECEITQIELTNMLSHDIRKRFPESFRLARRISNILKNDQRFSRFSAGYEKLGNQHYGLFQWDSNVDTAVELEIANAVEMMPHYVRDNRGAGCAGDSQIIISNVDLADMVYQLLYNVQALMTVKQIRDGVMKRLPIFDVNIYPIENYNTEEDENEFEIADVRKNPEQEFLDKEFSDRIENLVDEFMWSLSVAVKHKQKQHKLILDILFHSYLSGDNHNQYAVSKILGVSDALVSGYRKTIESILANLKIGTMSEALQFQSALKVRIKELQK